MEPFKNLIPLPRGALEHLVDIRHELEALAHDEEKDNDNDNCHHPALLEYKNDEKRQ
jgi:hypothetical protein